MQVRYRRGKQKDKVVIGDECGVEGDLGTIRLK